MIQTFISGLMLCAGLIVSIGPQNTELLRVGLLQENALLLASVYVVCDVFLISTGVLGVGQLIPLSLCSLFTLVTIALLGYLATQAFRRAHKHIKTAEALVFQQRKPMKKYALVLKGIGLSLFNPLAILETLVILGGASLKYPPNEKLFFAVGAISASTMWFYGVAYGTKKFAYFFQSKKGQLFLELGIGCVLLLSALSLGYRALGL